MKRKKDFLTDWTENEKYEVQLPNHPLSEMKEFFKYVAENQ